MLSSLGTDTRKPVSISQVTLSRKTLTIGGDGSTYTTTIVSNQGGFGGYTRRSPIVREPARQLADGHGSRPHARGSRRS